MKNTLAIVVLTWNNYKDTILCVKSILNQDFQDFNIFIVDNNSSDESFIKISNWLKKNQKKKFFRKEISTNIKINKKILSKYKVFFSINKKNLGCGYGHNTGYKIAIKNNFKFVARIDNDMEMPKNFFSKILRNFDNKIIQAVSPKILYKDQKDRVWWKGTHIGNNLKFQSKMRNYEYRLKDSTLFKNTITSDAIAGCASIMRVERLKKIGLSDKDFFYGPEDIEFSKRIKTTHDSLIVDLNSKIYHGVSKSFTKIPLTKIYYEYKYRLLLIKKIGSFNDKLFGYSIAVVYFFGYIIFSFKKKHRRKLKPVFYALYHFFTNKLGDFDRKQKFSI